MLPRASDLAMPHSWEMVQRLFEPVTGLAGADSMAAAVADASLFTLGLAAQGWLIGLAVGLVAGARDEPVQASPRPACCPGSC